MIKKSLIYLSLLLTPLLIYPFTVDNGLVDMRSIRTVGFFCLSIIVCAFLQKNNWLRLFIVWCVINWWLHFFRPMYSDVVLTNILSALILFIGIKHLLKTNVLSVNALMTLICFSILFQYGWAILQMFNIDPVFYPVSAKGEPISINMPIVSWSGNTSIFGIFLASFSFLLLRHFKIKGFPLFFLIVTPMLLIVKNATTIICFFAGLTTYIMVNLSISKKLTLRRILLFIVPAIVGLLLFLIYVKHPNFDRWEIWKQALPNVINHPIIGTGLSSFIQYNVWIQVNTPVAQAHNDYLQIVLELGFVGAFFLFGYIVNRLLFFFKYVERKDVALLSCIVAFLTSALTMFPMQLAELSTYLIIVLACLEYNCETKIL